MRNDALSVIACGSIAAKDLPNYLVFLRQEIDLPLRVLLTASAARFVHPQVLAWHADEVYVADDPTLNPTEFAHRSLGLVVLPATANTLAAAALGLAATPAQTVLLAHERPALFFPNMNGSMWRKPATQRHVSTLRADGHTVVEPTEREMFLLWQKENGVGPAMPLPDEAAEAVVKWLEDALNGDDESA